MPISNKVISILISFILLAPSTANADIKITFGTPAYKHSYNSHHNSAYGQYRKHNYINQYYYNPYSSYRYKQPSHSNKRHYSYKNHRYNSYKYYYKPYSSQRKNRYQQAYEQGFHDGRHQKHQRKSFKFGR